MALLYSLGATGMVYSGYSGFQIYTQYSKQELWPREEREITEARKKLKWVFYFFLSVQELKWKNKFDWEACETIF